MPERNTDQHHVSPVRNMLAGAIGLASVIAPGISAAEGMSEVPELKQSAETAVEATEYLDYQYRSALNDIENGMPVDIKYDQDTNRLNIGVAYDPDLSLAPFEQAQSSLYETDKDISRTSWLALGGAVGLLAATAIGRPDRQLQKGGNVREAIKGISAESRGLFAGLLLVSGTATGILVAGGHTQQTVSELSKINLDKLTEVSDSIKADVEKLDIRITHSEDKTYISLKPDQEAIGGIEKKARSLGIQTPNIEEKDLMADGLLLSMAGFTVIGLAGSTINVASATRRLLRRDGSPEPKDDFRRPSRLTTGYNRRPALVRQRTHQYQRRQR